MRPVSLALRGIAAFFARDIRLEVEGLEHLPHSGGALLAVRHYHHLYDGVALVRGLPRLPHLFVALDWVRTPWQRAGMERLCSLAEWPVALRAENLVDGVRGPFAPGDARRYVRRSIRDGAALLRRGEVVAIFPEAYPTIDPAGERKAGDEFLPFRPGLLAIAREAERNGPAIPIVPVGLHYARRKQWEIVLRLGAPLRPQGHGSRSGVLQELAARVRDLST